jgi:restriction system protein
MDINEAYHYPPELLQLLIDVIPRLSKSKRDTLLFFRGAGTPETMLADIEQQLATNPKNVNKFQMARTVLTRVNAGGDPLLRVRREIVKRVAEFEAFTRCWENDQLQARGLVAQVREIVNVKDSFTRINIERQKELNTHRATRDSEMAQRTAERLKRDGVKDRLFALFAEPNAQLRGKALEAVLNEVFSLDGMLVREAFCLRGAPGEGIIEQIDGVVQLDGHLYLVEMKWWNAPLGPGDVAQHLVRLFGRADIRGIFISYTDFTAAALASCRDALHSRVVTLAMLQEIVAVLQRGDSVAAMLRTKITAAMVDKTPYFPTV